MKLSEDRDVSLATKHSIIGVDPDNDQDPGIFNRVFITANCKILPNSK